MKPLDSHEDLTPLVLLVDDQEWTSRSIESILRPRGHVVLKAYTGQQALSLLQKVSPDALIVDVHLPDIDGVDLVRQLSSFPTIHSMTPRLMITGGSVTRAERLEALGAGAWDILTHPVDANELILRMETFVRAKLDADRLRDEGLTDPATGFYNARGLFKRAKEISSDATRFERPVTCLAFGLDSNGTSRDDESLLEEVARQVAAALSTVTRISDTVGRLGAGEFVVIAAGTDADGALRLADRVLDAADSEVSATGRLDPELVRRLRAGFCAASGDEPMAPEDLLLKASMALRQAQAEEGSFRVRAYES